MFIVVNSKELDVNDSLLRVLTGYLKLIGKHIYSSSLAKYLIGYPNVEPIMYALWKSHLTLAARILRYLNVILENGLLS